jgi:hypothetical protein
MNKFKEIINFLFSKKVDDVAKSDEVLKHKIKSLMDNPRLLEYLDKGWADLVLNQDGSPLLVSGKMLYQITQNEEGLRMSRLLEINRILEQSEKFGLSKKRMTLSRNLIKATAKSGYESDGSEVEHMRLCFRRIEAMIEQQELNQQVGLDDELIFSLASIVFVAEDEDPTNLDSDKLAQRIYAFRENRLAFFFYKHSYKILSNLGSLSQKDMENSISQSITALEEIGKVMFYQIAEYQSLNSSKLSETEFGYWSVAMETLQLEIKCLNQMLSISTIGSSLAKT